MSPLVWVNRITGPVEVYLAVAVGRMGANYPHFYRSGLRQTRPAEVVAREVDH